MLASTIRRRRTGNRLLFRSHLRSPRFLTTSISTFFHCHTLSLCLLTPIDLCFVSLRELPGLSEGFDRGSQIQRDAAVADFGW